MTLKLPAGAFGAELSRLYPKAFSQKRGTPCRWEASRAKGFRIVPGPKEVLIEIAGTDDLMLALGEILAAGKALPLEKTPALGFRGIMLDASRNAVPRVDFLKERLVRLALLGLNRFCLYTEDTYPVPGEPLFGYARGRYAEAELRALVAHGKLFGVTLFPCIQTLGHMEHILKYPRYANIKDNDMIYNVYAEETYPFIEKTIDAARAPYDTDFIHIGMDETHGLGRGLAFKENEPINPRMIYVKHLQKVAEICRRKGLKAAMWGDIVLGTTGNEHAMGESETSQLPRDLTMTYWEYAWCDPAKYRKNLEDFKRMGYDPIVAPGVWSWSRFFPAYYKGEQNISTMLEAAKAAGVQGALNTQWGDDGHECFFDWNLPAHAFFLASATETDHPAATARKKFQAVCGEEFDAVRSVEEIDLGGYKMEGLLPLNVGKALFYDDPAQGLFSGTAKVKPAGAFYRKQAKRLGALAKRKSMFRPLFRFAESFCDFLSVKADLRRAAAAAYKKKDRKALKALLKDIAAARGKLAKVQDLYRSYWLYERSPFGLEIIDGRMGALSARLDYLARSISGYLKGDLQSLPELDFPHYPMYHGARNPEYDPAIWSELMVHYSSIHSRNAVRWWW